jgi:hypothetical protein
MPVRRVSIWSDRKSGKRRKRKKKRGGRKQVRENGGDSEGWTRCYLCYHVIAAKQERKGKGIDKDRGKSRTRKC